MPDRYESLRPADLWMRDGLRVCRPPGGWASVEADMTQSLKIAEALSLQNVKATYQHVIFRAIALTLKRHPDLHKMSSGNRIVYPEKVDLGISLASESFVAPVMVLRSADSTPLPAMVKGMLSLVRQAKRDDRKLRRMLDRWGWLVPFGCARRLILSCLFNYAWFKRGGVGTFQVTCVPDLDVACPFKFNTVAILGVGGIRDRAVVVNGAVEIRPMVTLACCGNHELWDGKGMAQFLTTLKHILESGELKSEAPDAAVQNTRSAQAG